MNLVKIRLRDEGLKIPRPGITRRLIASGESVDADETYYRRLITDGDLIVVTEDVTATNITASTKAAAKESAR